jgi:Family of unknown function (DUF6166)
MSAPDIVNVWRTPDGVVHVNVPHVVVHHSPDGFECGYGGSGPADLALNILAAYLPISKNRARCFEGEVSAEAYALHQNFKWEFIASMPRTGGDIPAEIIRAWISKNSLLPPI